MLASEPVSHLPCPLGACPVDGTSGWEINTLTSGFSGGHLVSAILACPGARPVFDDPNLLTHAGLVPLLDLASRAGLAPPARGLHGQDHRPVRFGFLQRSRQARGIALRLSPGGPNRIFDPRAEISFTA